MPGLINLRPLPSAATTATRTNPGGRTHSSKSIATFKPDKAFEERINPPLISSRIRLLQLPVAQPLKPSQLQACAGLEEVADPMCENSKLGLYAGGLLRERMKPDYSSSGSDHDPSSISLAAMVHEFMESHASSGTCGRPRCNCLNGSCSGEACTSTDRRECTSITSTKLSNILQGLVQSVNEMERTLLAEVVDIVNSITEIGSFVGNDQGKICVNGCHRRATMKKLRMRGYNAAVCKSRWYHSVDFPAGDYEYIDVIVEGTSGKSERLIVDVDFRAQFEIARPTNQYVKILQLLPPIYVGKLDRLQEILVVMCDASKQSLKTTGLHLPPWRKPGYLRAKWFSPFKRTTNDADHPQRENEISSGRLYASIAIGGSGMDARHTNELEILFHKVAARLPKDMNAKNNGRNEKGMGKPSDYDVSEALASRADRSGREWDEIKVMTTEWQLPSVGQRSSSQKPAKVAGLASVLLQAGLSTGAETRPENAAMEERVAIAV